MILIFVFLLSATRAEFAARCSNATQPISFKTAADGVPGRYTMSSCVNFNTNNTHWKTTIKVGNQEDCTKCSGSKMKWHSSSNKSLYPQVHNLACSIVCLDQEFDLIYAGCYSIQAVMMADSSQREPVDACIPVVNNFTMEHFNNSKTVVNVQSYGRVITAHWFTSFVPITEYYVDLISDNSTREVEQSCSSPQYNKLECSVDAPHGHYTLALEHVAPWTSGLLRHHTWLYTELEHSPAREQGVLAPGGGRALWWVCGAVLAASGALAVMYAVWRSRLRRKMERAVYQAWTSVTRGSPAQREGAGSVLVVYAREGGAGARVAADLVALLRAAAPPDTPVYDIHSAEVLALGARAPAEWVRRALHADRARCVLLQTAAMAALLPSDLGLVPEQPLLQSAGGVAYRCPQFGDTLVQYVWRCVRDTAHRPRAPPLLATLSAMPVDIAPELDTFRRYELPEAAYTLVRDLCPAADLGPLRPLVTQLGDAAADFAQLVARDPGYLAADLVALDA